MNWTLIFIRAALLPIGAFAGGLFLASILHRTQSSDWGSWVAFSTLLVTLVLLWARWRGLQQWEDGIRGCQYCGGPVGFQRPGKVYFGRQLSDYRTCFNCGRHTPEVG